MRNNLKFLHIVLLSAALLAANREAAAQLISGTFSGAVTLLSPASSDLLPAVELGSPMQVSFTYQADAPIGTATTDRVRSYFYNGGTTHAALSFADGAATFETNALTLTLIPSFEFGTSDARTFFGDSVSIHAENSNAAFTLALLYPAGTFNGYDPALPFDFQSPAVIDMASVIWDPANARDRVTAFSTSVLGGGISPVPESTTLGLAAALMLGGIVAFRRRRPSRPAPSPIGRDTAYPR